METLFLILAVAAYGIATAGYLVYLFRDRKVIHRVSSWVLVMGAAFHATAIVLHSIHKGRVAVANSQEALSFFALTLVVTYLVVQLRLNLRILGSFVSPLAVLFMLVSSLLPDTLVPKTGVFQSAWVVLHVAALFLANSLFAVAFSAAVMYLLQERHIKRKNLGFLYSRLPPLERLDSINHFCLVIGFPLMTLGLITGFAFAGREWKSLWNWDPKEIFALITWLIYAFLLHERLAVGWRGRRAAWLAIFGFTAVLITFLGVNLFLKGHHTAFIK